MAKKISLESLANKIEKALAKPLGVLAGGSWGELGIVTNEAIVLTNFNYYGWQDIEKLVSPYGYSHSGYNHFERLMVYAKKSES